MNTTILSAEDIRAIVAHVGLDPLMDEVIAKFADACAIFDESEFAVPARTGFHYGRPNTGMIEWMPVMETGRKATIKMVSSHPNNPAAHKLPTILSTLLIFDTSSGHLASAIDGTFLTAMRTGAASAVASRVLAASDSSTLGLIGCGAQAITQLHGLSRVFDIRKVMLFDTDEVALSNFPKRARQLELLDICFETASVETVVAEADILCTCTTVETDRGPVFDDTNLKPWLHINAVGSDFPGKFEVPHNVLTRSLVVPDFRPQAIAEGECQQLHENEIGPDLVALISEQSHYHEYRSQPTVFDSTGWALEDHVAGEILVDRARTIGVGSEIQLESISSDPKNPYGFMEESPHETARKLVAVD